MAAAIALVAALALGGGFFEQGVLFVNQSATSAILMIAVAGTATSSQWLSDALIGGGVTLVITVILFPAAPLPLIQDAVQQVFATLRDTLAHLADLAGTAGPEWTLAAGHRLQSQLAGLQQGRSTARQVASLSPRRWPERVQVRRAGEQTAPVGLLAATVLSLAHASAAGLAVQQPHSRAWREALGELTSAFATLAEGGDASATQAALHATRSASSFPPAGSGAVAVPRQDPRVLQRLARDLSEQTAQRVSAAAGNGC